MKGKISWIIRKQQLGLSIKLWQNLHGATITIKASLISFFFPLDQFHGISSDIGMNQFNDTHYFLFKLKIPTDDRFLFLFNLSSFEKLELLLAYPSSSCKGFYDRIHLYYDTDSYFLWREYCFQFASATWEPFQSIIHR